MYIYIVAIGLLIKTVTPRVLGVKCIVSCEKTSQTLLKNTHKYLKKRHKNIPEKNLATSSDDIECAGKMVLILHKVGFHLLVP